MATGLDYRYGKTKNAPTLAYRMMTLDEARSFTGSHAPIRDQHGNVRTAKINGRVRTWKRNVNRIEVPLKYGLYDYLTDTAIDGEMTYLVVILDQHGETA